MGHSRIRERLAYLGIAISILLLGLKTWAGIASHSVAVLSDALNSLLDILTYTVIAVSVGIQHKEPDKSHPYGHYRAEPLAGFVVAVVGVLLGVTIAKDAVRALFEPHDLELAVMPVAVMILSIVTKVVMSVVYSRVGHRTRSLALTAASVDSRNDVLASSTALLGLALSGVWDAAAGVAIGMWIAYSGVRMGIESSGYLLGRSPGEGLPGSVREMALEVPGVLGVNDIRAHFVGSYVHLEVHVEVDRSMTVEGAHAISDAVEAKLQSLDDVAAVFVHLDVLGDPVRFRL